MPAAPPPARAATTADWLERLAPAPRIVDLAAGAGLFRQGDPVFAVFRVLEGRLRLVRHLTDGVPVALHTARRGETLAEAALFAEAYHCDAVAEAPSRIACHAKGALLAGLAADGGAALELARLLAGQVQGLRGRLELRNIRSAGGRLLQWLRLAAGGAPELRLDRPWTEVAAELGLSQEAVYRALAALERDGALRRSGGVVILRPEA
ncbi:MAG TPA: Crp/Fnr family transcriptional regulator [Alphaproteobacteria bacterium]|nr:Crp/Fnr family transcriptional regulator [Alphaproteobacteria bacterium]